MISLSIIVTPTIIIIWFLVNYYYLVVGGSAQKVGKIGLVSNFNGIVPSHSHQYKPHCSHAGGRPYLALQKLQRRSTPQKEKEKKKS